MNPAIEHCLRASTDVATCEDVAHWWPAWLALQARWSQPIERAIAAGFEADRVAWAFAGGYQAALRGLLPALPADVMAAFCVTEATGNRPRDVHTRFVVDGDTLQVDGAKRWSTLGPASSRLLVVGRLAAADGAERIALRVAVVPSDAPGVAIQPMPATRFVPEVAHASIRLDAVRLPASALLPGDGYDGYVKPFRTIEDTQVTAAVVAYLLREARARTWPPAWCERAVLVLNSLVGVAGSDPAAPTTHLLLEGTLQLAHQLFGEADRLFAQSGDGDSTGEAGNGVAGRESPAAARWVRDRALLSVASSARTLRAQRAWERLAARDAGPER